MAQEILILELWKMNSGTNNSKRRIVSIDSCIKNDDGTYTFIGRSSLYGRVRDNKIKTNRVRRNNKLTHHG